MLEQNVMQLNFNDSGRLQAMKKYDLSDARDIDMVSRITPTAGKELTVLEQIMASYREGSAPVGYAPTGLFCPIFLVGRLLRDGA